jgi:hypothetical protein
MPPIKLSDDQLGSIFQAARPLAVHDRDGFLQAVAEQLNGRRDIGDGDVARAIRAVQRQFFDPPITDERIQPHSRAWVKAR